MPRGSRRADKKKGDGVGVCRCVLEGERGVMPFSIKRLNWFNLAILIDIIAISISIPDPVAVRGGILPPGYGTPSPTRRLTLA